MGVVAGNYITTASPTVVQALMVQMETRVLLGLYRLYASLEVTSAAYISHMAPIGMQANTFIDLGELSGLGFEHVPTFEQSEAANVLQSSVEQLTEEETTITIGIKQFDARVLEALVGTGVLYTYGNERQLTVGGACTQTRRPIVFESTNLSCNAPTVAGSVLTGVRAMVTTFYDCGSTSGLPWGEIVANAINVLDTEWKAYPVTAHNTGNRLFNIVLM